MRGQSGDSHDPRGLALNAMRRRLAGREVTERKQVGDVGSMMNDESGDGSYRPDRGGSEWVE